MDVSYPRRWGSDSGRARCPCGCSLARTQAGRPPWVSLVGRTLPEITADRVAQVLSRFLSGKAKVAGGWRLVELRRHPAAWAWRLADSATCGRPKAPGPRRSCARSFPSSPSWVPSPRDSCARSVCSRTSRWCGWRFESKTLCAGLTG